MRVFCEAMEWCVFCEAMEWCAFCEAMEWCVCFVRRWSGACVL